MAEAGGKGVGGSVGGYGDRTMFAGVVRPGKGLE